MEKRMQKEVRASYTVEAAGVMAAVLFTILFLMNRALSFRAETVGYFGVHEAVERDRHLIENMEEREISRQDSGSGWSMEITTSVFRPEHSLRLWSLAEDME